MSFGERIGMYCTLDGKVVKFLEMLYDQSSGEINEICEIYLEEVEE